MKLTIETIKTKNNHIVPVLKKDGFVISYDRELIADMLGMSKSALYALFINSKEPALIAEWRKG